MSILPRAHGGPALRAVLRATPEDFIVEEDLGFEASGTGEHVLLTVRKRQTNTDWLAGRIAEFSGVKRSAVNYAGLKDRHAVTTQTFSVHLPGKAEPDWSAFPEAEVQILDSRHHQRKLRRGALSGNRFTITLRDIDGKVQAAEDRLHAISAHGVPNYFGEQRFGRGGHNIARAQAFFQGQKVSRKQQGMLISSARAEIFNAVLAERVTAGHWNQLIDGEACCLNGSRSWFLSDSITPELRQRALELDIHPSGPLWGEGELPTRSDAGELEAMVAARHAELRDGLARQRMDHDRRSLRLLAEDLDWEWLSSAALRLCFRLPAGSYATTLLRELADWTEPAHRQ